MPDSADRTIDLSTLAVVDVETSGLSPASHRILSVAVVQLDAAGKPLTEFHSLVDPGCDPGPVHVHGLTRARLAGSPTFDALAPRLAGLLRGRTVVAHNASFDVAFLEAEFRRCGQEPPTAHRLCTLALARRVAPPTADCRLATLAAHYGVPQRNAHDALDDSRVLAAVLRGLLSDAGRFGVIPSTVTVTSGTRPGDVARAGKVQGRRGPKPPCAYRNPGRLSLTLVQGMKIAITGETDQPRSRLIEAGDAAGLDMVGSVSRHTSALVTNDRGARSRKMSAAAAHAVPLLSERDFLSMMANIAPGVAKEVAIARTPRIEPPRKLATVGPLGGRRVLVLGGTHRSAGDVRQRVVELGGSAAVNLSRTVTDVIVLEGGERDPRRERAAGLGLGIHGIELVLVDGPAPVAGDVEPKVSASAPIDMQRGQVIDLPVDELGTDWTLRVTWAEDAPGEVDVVAFVLDDGELVSGDEDFVFFNQPVTPGVRLQVNSATDQGVSVSLADLPDQARRVVVAAAVDGDGDFGAIGAIEVEVSAGAEGATVARGTLDAATTERSLRLMELYLRGDSWRLRAVGQGYGSGLAELAELFGVDVD